MSRGPRAFVIVVAILGVALAGLYVWSYFHPINLFNIVNVVQ